MRFLHSKLDCCHQHSISVCRLSSCCAPNSSTDHVKHRL